MEQSLVEMHTKLKLATEDLGKYFSEKLRLEGKEVGLREEVEKWKAECVTNDAATFNDHADGFNRALAQVVSFYPTVDLSNIELYKDVVDGKVIDSSSPPGTPTPKV